MSKPPHEQIDKTARTSRGSRTGRGSGVVFGILLLFAGVVFLLDNLDMMDAGRFIEWWPLALVAIGIGELFGGSRVGAVIWMAIGGWFLLNRLDVIDLDLFDLFWPSLWVAVGALLVWQSMMQPKVSEASDRMSSFALMAGNVQRSAGASVRSVQATAVMGGCEIDLRKMAPGQRETVVDVFAMWGGIEISIPEGWALENRVMPIIAGVEDKTAPAAPDAPRLILRGTVVMGGVEVRN